MLLVVDVQNGFLNEHSSHILPAVERLVAEFECRKLPIVYSKFINTPGGPFERLLNWYSVRERPETDLHEAFATKAVVVIEKCFYSALTGQFVDLLEENLWDPIVVCGISTESCVLKTAVDVFERDRTAIVVSDACASDHGQNMHRAGLSIIKIMVGKNQVLTIDELFE